MNTAEHKAAMLTIMSEEDYQLMIAEASEKIARLEVIRAGGIPPEVAFVFDEKMYSSPEYSTAPDVLDEGE